MRGVAEGGRKAPKDHAAAVCPLAHSIPEACRILGAGRSTIYELIAAGELRSFRIKSRRLVSADALAQFVRDREGP